MPKTGDVNERRRRKRKSGEFNELLGSACWCSLLRISNDVINSPKRFFLVFDDAFSELDRDNWLKQTFSLLSICRWTNRCASRQTSPTGSWNATTPVESKRFRTLYWMTSWWRTRFWARFQSRPSTATVSRPMATPCPILLPMARKLKVSDFDKQWMSHRFAEFDFWATWTRRISC